MAPGLRRRSSRTTNIIALVTVLATLSILLGVSSTAGAAHSQFDNALHAPVAGQDGGEQSAAHRNLLDTSHLSSSTSILSIATVLVVFGILFDWGKDALFEKTGKHAMPVLTSLFGELTLLGFIGLIMFAVEKGKLLDGLSDHIFGEGDYLSGLVEDVHMALFLIMVLFLLMALLFLQVSRRLTRQWHADEVEALFPKKVMEAYARSKAKRLRANCCKRMVHWVFAMEQESKEHRRMVHTSMRRTFLESVGVDVLDVHHLDENKQNEAELIAAAQANQPVLLNRSTGNEYRKNIQVHAFEVDSPIKVFKSWGLSEGKANDWIVCGEGGDVYMNRADEFLENYEKVSTGQPHVFRKKTTVLAKQMPCSFLAKKKDGTTINGRPGHYLVQTTGSTVEQYAVDPKQFTDQYVRLNAGDEKEDKHKMQYVDFNLAAYFSIIMGRLLGDIVNIEVITWVAVELLLLIFYALASFASKLVFSVTMVVVGYALALLLSVLLNKLRRIQGHLMDRTLWEKAHILMEHAEAVSKARGGNGKAGEMEAMNLDAPLIGSVRQLPPPHELKPAYTRHKLKPRTRCGKWFLGHPGSKHENLFWFDRHGVDVVIHLVRILMLVLAVYLATASLLIYDYQCTDSTWWACGTWYLVAFIPVLIQLSLLPQSIRAFVVVSSVEMMKNRSVMEEVVRDQRARKSLRALRLVSAMKNRVHKLESEAKAEQDVESGHLEIKAGPHQYGKHKKHHGHKAHHKAHHKAAPKLGHADRRASTVVYGQHNDATYLKRRAELLEAFNMFDQDNSGEINADEMAGVLEIIGLRDEAEEIAHRIVLELDVDADGSISFDEFFEWIASIDLETAQDTEELDEHIFDLIDVDNSHTITVDELRAALLSMGEVMSYDDIVQIVREADADGDGVIDREEFVRMMQRHTQYDNHM